MTQNHKKEAPSIGYGLSRQNFDCLCPKLHQALGHELRWKAMTKAKSMLAVARRGRGAGASLSEAEAPGALGVFRVLGS